MSFVETIGLSGEFFEENLAIRLSIIYLASTWISWAIIYVVYYFLPLFDFLDLFVSEIMMSDSVISL